jgi:hypothetical protein
VSAIALPAVDTNSEAKAIGRHSLEPDIFTPFGHGKKFLCVYSTWKAVVMSEKLLFTPTFDNLIFLSAARRFPASHENFIMMWISRP